MADRTSRSSEYAQPVTLECVDRNGHGLRVTFPWHRDRYAHTIALIDGQHVVPLLASEEGNDRDDWPASPPLQQLSVQQRPDGTQVALLVGMAGSGHWSLSVQTLADPPRIEFDVACRARQRPTRLGSSYRTLMTPPRSEAQTDVMLAVSNHRCRLQVESIAGQSPASVEPSAVGIRVLRAADHVSLPATIRWKYCVAFVESSQCVNNSPTVMK